MLNRSTEIRLRKLEGARRAGVFFLLWGRSVAELEERTNEARAAGLFGRGDTVVRALWTERNGGPPSRWVADQKDWSAEEDSLLTAEVERRISFEELVDKDAADQGDEQRLRRMSDAELFAAALGEVVG